VSDYCLTSIHQFVSYIMARTDIFLLSFIWLGVDDDWTM